MCMKRISLLIVLLVTFGLKAQVGIFGGGSGLIGFGAPKPWGGFHLGVEVPRDDQMSYYLKYTHHFAVQDNDSLNLSLTPRDYSTLPPGYPLAPNIGSYPTMNYNIICFGTRYYIGSGYDFGWSAYGGTEFLLTFNKVRAKTNPYDEEHYYLEDFYNYEGSAFSLGFGFNAGVKYSVPPWGTIYFDLNLSYILLYNQNSDFMYNGMVQPLTFGASIGYRKDILWQ